MTGLPKNCRGHELANDGGSAKNVIACRYHAWRFQLDGELAFANNCEHVATQLQRAPRTITDTPAN